MSSEACPFEADLLRAARGGEWSEALRGHVATCGDCAAAAAVSGWMHDFALVEPRRHKLPDPAVVWLKAQLLRSSVVADRVARPITMFQIVAYAVVASGWAALLTWKWPAIEKWLSLFSPEKAIATAATQSGAAVSLPFFATLLVLSTVTITLALHTILAEE